MILDFLDVVNIGRKTFFFGCFWSYQWLPKSPVRSQAMWKG